MRRPPRPEPRNPSTAPHTFRGFEARSARTSTSGDAPALGSARTSTSGDAAISERPQKQARISPTGCPPPSSATRPVRRTASASTPASSSTPLRSRAAAISTGRTRGGAVVGLERERPPVGQRHGVARLGAGLADRAGDRGQQLALVAAAPGHVRRVLPDRVGDPGRARVGRVVPVEPEGQPAGTRGPARSATSRAAAHRSRRPRPPRPARRSSRRRSRRWRPGAGGRAAGRSRRPSRGRRRSRAWRRACRSSSSAPARGPAGPQDRLAGGVVEREVGRGLQGGLVEPGAGEDLAGPRRRGSPHPSGRRRRGRAARPAGRGRPGPSRAPGPACCTTAAAPALSTAPTDHSTAPSESSATTEP